MSTFKASDLASFIRETDGDHRLGAAEMAERIHAWVCAGSDRPTLQEQGESLHDVVQERFDLLHMAMPADPREAVTQLINAEVRIALDPSVSCEAEALIERGRQQHAGGVIPADCDVRTILLDVVPGDGDGLEVYAKNTAQVVDKLTELAVRAEEAESKLTQQQAGGEVGSVAQAVGPYLRRQANHLLRQLSENRPRRAIDLAATRQLLETIAAKSDTELLIGDLIRNAWEWGVSCEIDDVRWGEPGDSHNQMLRDRANDSASRLQAALLTATPAPEPKAIDWHAVVLRLEQAHDLSLDGHHGHTREMLRDVCKDLRAGNPEPKAEPVPSDGWSLARSQDSSDYSDRGTLGEAEPARVPEDVQRGIRNGGLTLSAPGVTTKSLRCLQSLRVAVSLIRWTASSTPPCSPPPRPREVRREPNQETARSPAREVRWAVRLLWVRTGRPLARRPHRAYPSKRLVQAPRHRSKRPRLPRARRG